MPNEVVILPGLPRALSTPDDASSDLYPDTTTDMIKILRLNGLSVAPLASQMPELIGHKSYDVWLPIIQFSLSTLGGASGNLLSTLILDYFHPRKPNAIVHIKWHVELPDGSTETFEFDGPGEQAVDAAGVFERRLHRRRSLE